MKDEVDHSDRCILLDAIVAQWLVRAILYARRYLNRVLQIVLSDCMRITVNLITYGKQIRSS